MTTYFTTSMMGTFVTISNLSDTPLNLDPSMNIGSIHFNHSNTPLRRPHIQNTKQSHFTSWRKGMFRLSNDGFIFHDSSSKRNGKAKRVFLPHAPTDTPTHRHNLKLHPFKMIQTHCPQTCPYNPLNTHHYHYHSQASLQTHQRTYKSHTIAS